MFKFLRNLFRPAPNRRSQWEDILSPYGIGTRSNIPSAVSRKLLLAVLNAKDDKPITIEHEGKSYRISSLHNREKLYE
jgi:hypothetical protein